MARTPRDPTTRKWTFLTNHAHVLLAIARDPTVRLRDVAEEVGITERAAQAIVADLESCGYLQHSRVGRRNEYTVNPAGRFRHPAAADHSIGDLLTLFATEPSPDHTPERRDPPTINTPPQAAT